MKPEGSGKVTDCAGSSDRIEHRPSKPLLKTAPVRGETGVGGGPFAHRLPQNLLDAARLALKHLEDRHYNYGNDWHDHEASDVATALERAIDDAERGT